VATEKPKIALVLSGGGAKGFAHIGVLHLIDELGIEIDYIIGTSMGAVIGGMYAAGYTAKEIESIITNICWSSIINDTINRDELHINRKKWLPTGNFYFRLDHRYIPGLPQGMIMGNKILLELFSATWGVAHIHDFSQLKIPFWCIATNIETGEMVIFERGTLADVMRASSSMPSIFTPMELDGMLLIDGGISQNFPVDIAKQLGGDIIIGSRTSTEMLNRTELTNPVNILMQTINIGMKHRQTLSEGYADITISPDLDEFTLMGFDSVHKIIEKGYLEAKKHIDELLALCKPGSRDIDTPEPDELDRLSEYISFSAIRVRNNQHLTPYTVRDYLGLQSNVLYSRDDVMSAFSGAYATELFDLIYPNIYQTGDSYELIVNVKEKERKHLGVNFIYNQHDHFVAGIIIRMKNELLLNSNLLVNFQFGGKYALDIDYTKAFLRDQTVYYRLFPYIKNDNIFFYDEEYKRVSKHNINEYGFTAGIGFHPIKNTIIEPYLFSYRIDYTRSIATQDLFDSYFISTGAGIKLYYESLNDFPFYTKGFQLFSKYSIASENPLSNIGYRKMTTSMIFAQPINDHISLLMGGEYGTYFDSETVEQDPFYIGGIDNFLGLSPYGLLAPHYRKLDLGLRLNPINNFFIDIKTNYITYSGADKWPVMDESRYGVGLVVGYKSLFGPCRIGIAINDNKRFFTYVSIGYDYDAFMLSRR
jgi:NTE family protein